jgi:hypothetical protein
MINIEQSHLRDVGVDLAFFRLNTINPYQTCTRNFFDWQSQFEMLCVGLFRSECPADFLLSVRPVGQISP